MSSSGNQYFFPRHFFPRRYFSAAAVTFAFLLGVNLSAHAALEVTEVMVNPLNENVWQWIEVRNLGPDPVDLHGAYGDRLGDPRILSTDPPSIDNAKASNTMIPVGGVAVLYDANLPGTTNADFNDQLFRDAWDPSGTEPLIGVDFFPALSNGSSIGFWENYTDYALDLVDPGSGNLVVGSFDNALFGIDFRSGFPVTPNGTSMRWNGNGIYQSGVNWTLSDSGFFGAVTSVPASVQSPINSTFDLGSPGVQPAGSFRSALFITELMANPASDEPDWEWIEVLNGTGDLINFADLDTKYVLDDTDGSDLLASNITSGSIPSGTTAVLYNGDALTLQNMQDAWTPSDPNGINFIAVSNFSELGTTGTVAIWSNFIEYTSETITGPGRSTDNAATVLVNYDNGGEEWPSFNGVSSIQLADLNADPNDPFPGDFWTQSALSDGISFNASEALGEVEIHAGGDVGSPGAFGITAANDADFDNDIIVDGIDFLIWQRGLGIGTSHAAGDANADGIVNEADLAIWESQYGAPPPLSAAWDASSAVPEPASAVLLMLGFALLGRRAHTLSGKRRAGSLGGRRF